MNKLAIILIGIVLLVVYGLLAMDYMKQGPEHERLLSEIEEINQSREALPEPSTYFSEQLVVIQAALDAESVTIPGEINSTDVLDTILSLADDIGVKAIPLITQPWMEVHIGVNTYSILRINVDITGLFSSVKNYVSRLESGDFKTLIVESLIVNVDYGDGEEVYAGGSTPVVASLDVAVFAKP
ncbi:MAG TPA: hypothetical protein G4O18_03140 [Dehalococcoidia bacterium]|nr:hypothetical protein [Dehalococcoidia bacterium]